MCPERGHLILVRVPMLRPIKDRQNGPKQRVWSFCKNNIISVFSETQGVLGTQLGTRAGTSTRVPEVQVGYTNYPGTNLPVTQMLIIECINEKQFQANRVK